MLFEYIQGNTPTLCKNTGSTRDKNSRANYCLEQQGINKIMNHRLYDNGPNGDAYNPAFPQYINPSKMPANLFSFNAVDIESALLNIGASNLVEPTKECLPLFKSNLEEIKFFEKTRLIKENMFIPSNTERPTIF
jgi:hypothetical protein